MKIILKLKRKRDDEHQRHVDLSKAERSISYPGQEWVRGRLLGEGGFGCVNMAFFPNPKVPKFRGMPPVTAVKSTRMSSAKELALEKDILDRFQDCPFIVRCLGDDVTYANDDNKQLVLNVFLELASGGTLFDTVAVSNESGLPEPKASRFTKSILGGLHRIHQEGFIHCDLKLDNVLLVKQGADFVAKVADLGLAKTIDQIEVGLGCGTELYWAPEMLTGGVQGQPSDIWALGCVVLAMLTGTLPWSDHGSLTSQELREVIATQSPVLPCGIFSDDAEDFLYKCFRRDPQKRATTAMLLSHPFVSGAAEEDDQSLKARTTDGDSKYILIEDSSSSEEESDNDDGFLMESPRPLKRVCPDQHPQRPFPIFGC